MKVIRISLILLTVLSFFSCKEQRLQDIEYIKNLESKTFSPNVVKLDTKLANELINAYEKFNKDYPDDTLSANYLFKAGEISMSMNDGKKALLFFEMYMKQYPEFKKAAHCLFLQGFVYETHLKDTATARKKYMHFLEKYPTHELVKDASASIELLGKSPEEIIKLFEERQKQAVQTPGK